MAEEEKTGCRGDGCQHTACMLNWLKVADTWAIGGWQNRLPRLYYVVGGLVLLFLAL